jgi:peptide deformylase
MIQKVLSVRDPRLRQKSKPVEKVDKRIGQLISDLEDTLEIQKDPEGVGLAAPQIGVFLRVFIMRVKGMIQSRRKTQNAKRKITTQWRDVYHYRITTAQSNAGAT